MLYRAVVTHTPKCGTVLVFFVDVGLSDEVSVNEVYVPSRELAEIPMLSIRSRLDGLPDTPDVTICNSFHKIISDKNLTFVAKVVHLAVDQHMTYISLDVGHTTSLTFSMLDHITMPVYEQCVLKDGAEALVAYHDDVSNAVFLHLKENLKLVNIDTVSTVPFYYSGTGYSKLCLISHVISWLKL